MDEDLDAARAAAIAQIDAYFAAIFDRIRGPLAFLHMEKLRQAEAGCGPLIDGEDDRKAILINAAQEAESVAEIERNRRRIKKKVLSAKTLAEIQSAYEEILDPKEKFLA